MLKRDLQNKIVDSLNNYPVIGLIGSRQAGKTTLAKEISGNFSDTVYIDLELPSDLIKIQNAEFYLKENSDKLIIIDEVQHEQKLFPIIRALVDQDRRSGRFLLLGSASPDFMRFSSETLAGRIIYHELTPLNIFEVKEEKNSIRNLWLKGGYPLSFLSKDPVKSFEWRESFIKTYLERDIPQLGLRIPAIQLRRFWTMVAHNHGKLWNASQIASSLGVTAPTVKHYLDILTDTFLVRQLAPFFENVKKRLVKSPKIYLRDSGLLHTLLNIRNTDDLLSHPGVGSSWEGFVIEQILNSTEESIQPYFYRTGSGNEIDLILESGRNNRMAIEVKHSLSPELTKGFWIAFEELKCKKGYVVYPGDDEFPINEKVRVVSLTKIKNEISSLTSK
ncbi:MAG: ATP-binding protein [Ignavibacteria bacterium]|nr:ATP-binding protein [Ignavibacteria bacterium]